jgi:hypothetical protein
MRKKEFKGEKPRNDKPNLDSRFGLRKKYLNPNETPSIFSYANPGRGVQGESQN